MPYRAYQEVKEKESRPMLSAQPALLLMLKKVLRKKVYS
jgi:hypothetical protein